MCIIYQANAWSHFPNLVVEGRTIQYMLMGRLARQCFKATPARGMSENTKAPAPAAGLADPTADEEGRPGHFHIGHRSCW